MNGSVSLIKTLVDSDIEVCFINPGTSEMHFVAALDEVDGMRCVLGLFENVVTGAADGYARMAGKPAATLLHLGPGMANGLSNIHNARRARTPMVNIVGDHATYHRNYDAPLTSDIEGVAWPMSDWVKTSKTSDEVAADTASAVEAAGRDKIATLVLPADVSWGDNSNGATKATPVPAPQKVSAADINKVAEMLADGEETFILLGGGHVDTEMGLMLSQLGQATGARVGLETFTPRLERGAGSAKIDRVPYLAETAIQYLGTVKRMVLIGAKAPVAFFAYPNVPSALYPETCELVQLAAPDADLKTCLTDLVAAVGADKAAPEVYAPHIPEVPEAGPLTTQAVAQSIARHMPENAIVVDESSTAGGGVPGATVGSPKHDWLYLTGGSLGYGMPSAIGAAVACPDRKVLNLLADGAAMYSPQGLWTAAREELDIVVVILNNRKYNILEMEFFRTGARNGVPGPKAASTLDIGNPNIDFAELARGMGVPGTTATTAEEFEEQLAAAMQRSGPVLIDAIVPPRVFGAS